MSSLKIVILILFLVAGSLLTYGQSSGILFKKYSSLSEIKQKAAAEEKNILIYLHYKGCVYCAKMEKEVFVNKQVAEFYNDQFVNISLDIFKDSLGIYLKKTYEPSGFPAFLYLNKKGELEYHSNGYQSVDEFTKKGKQLISLSAEYKHYETLIQNGNITATNLQKCFSLTAKRIPKDSLIQVYLSNASDEEKYSKETWNLLYDHARFYKSPFFPFILSNEKKFRTLMGDKEVDDYIISTWSFMINQWSSWWANDWQRNKMKNRLRETQHPLVERIIRSVNYSIRIERATYWQKSKHKWNKMISASKQYLEYGYSDWENYYKAAWIILLNYQKFGKNQDLDLAFQLTSKSISDRKEFINHFFHALVLYNLNDRDKAIETMKTALSLKNDKTEFRFIQSAEENLENWMKEKQK